MVDRRLSTGVPVIDGLLSGGLARGEVTAIASKPGMGKTMGLLAVAVEAGVDCVLYAPTLSYPDAKSRVATICQSLDVDVDSVTYDHTPGLWLSIRLPRHRVLVAGHLARATVTGKGMLENVEALLASGAASIAMFDAPCRKMDDDAERKFMRQLAKIAKRYSAPVIVTTMLHNSPGDDPVINDVNEIVGDVADDVIWISGWPRIVGGGAKFKVGVLSDGDHDGEWETKTAWLTLHPAISLGQAQTIGYKRQ